MSAVFRRGLSTLIPPKIASPSAIGAAQDAQRMTKIVSFYKALPRGPAPAPQAKGFLDRYRLNHFGEKPSAWPIWHTMIFLIAIGYGQAYYFHLRHHKNNAH